MTGNTQSKFNNTCKAQMKKVQQKFKSQDKCNIVKTVHMCVVRNPKHGPNTLQPNLHQDQNFAVFMLPSSSSGKSNPISVEKIMLKIRAVMDNEETLWP